MTVVTSLVVFSTVAAQAAVDWVDLTQNAYSYGPGGEFTANTAQNFLQIYSPLAIVNNSAASGGLGNGFETFCVETTVEFNPGQTYTYTLSSTDSLNRNLSLGAAYLYEQFGTGSLAGYNYSAIGTPDHNTDAGALQSAIWWFQGKQSYGGFPTATSDIYYLDAISALGGVANADAPNNGRFDVDILQLWNGNIAAQDQLVLVPDNSGTTGLFAMGLMGLAGLRRRFKAA